MKTTFALVLLLAGTVQAATYSVTTTTAQETVITRARTADNAIACHSLGLPDACTQAQADAVKPGAVVVFAANGPYLLNILKLSLTSKKDTQDEQDRQAFEAAKQAATQAQKDAACQALGLPVGCLP